MSPGCDPSTKRRLVGQPLIYAMTIFISLGVFLFGYDQGVMSGIIPSKKCGRHGSIPRDVG